MVSIETPTPFTMIDSEPGVRTKVAALEVVTKVGAGVTASGVEALPAVEPLSGVEPLLGA